MRANTLMTVSIAIREDLNLCLLPTCLNLPNEMRVTGFSLGKRPIAYMSVCERLWGGREILWLAERPVVPLPSPDPLCLTRSVHDTRKFERVSETSSIDAIPTR